MLSCNQVYENISFILNKEKVKISDIEDEANVSRGYLSRLKKSASSYPSVELLSVISKKCNVSIDTLMNVQFFNISPTEQYLFGFIKKLKDDTIADNLVWNVIESEKLSPILFDPEDDIDYPFLGVVKSICGESGYPESWQVGYKSFFDEHKKYIIENDVYVAYINFATMIYLIPVARLDVEKPDWGYDLYMQKKGNLSKLCCGDTNIKDLFYPELKMLYNEAINNENRIHLSDSVTSAIDAYMAGHPEDDDDLPF